jgi:hypothetical protein
LSGPSLRKSVMKATIALFIVAFPLAASSRALDVDAVLDRVEAERAAGYTKPKEAKAPNKKKQQASSESPSGRKREPEVEVHHPRIKLPKSFAGIRIAGKFAFIGTSVGGHPQLVAAEDAMNPFARQFWVENVQSDLGPNVTLTLDQRTLVNISPSNPLVLVKRGILPGIYWVHAQ